MLSPLREIISVCESEEKPREFFFFFLSYETYSRIIVIDLIIVN